MKRFTWMAAILFAAACGAEGDNSATEEVESSLSNADSAIAAAQLVGDFGGGALASDLFNLSLRADGTFLGARAVECANEFGLDCGAIKGSYVLSKKGSTKYITLDDLNAQPIAKYSYTIYAGSLKLTNVATKVKTALKQIALTDCAVDSDCVAVAAASCCDNGWKAAVNVNEASEYARANACIEQTVCPLYVVDDVRVAQCNRASHTCEMVQP